MATHSSVLAWRIPRTGEPWWAAVHGVANSQTWLSDFTFTFHFHALEKEMAAHSSVLAWRVPGTGEPGGLPSMGSHRGRHDWSDLAAAAACVVSSECDGSWNGFYFFSWLCGTTARLDYWLYILKMSLGQKLEQQPVSLTMQDNSSSEKSTITSIMLLVGLCTANCNLNNLFQARGSI